MLLLIVQYIALTLVNWRTPLQDNIDICCPFIGTFRVEVRTISIFVIIFMFCLVYSNIAATGMITSVYAKKHVSADSDKGSSTPRDSSSEDKKSSDNDDKSTEGGGHYNNR